MSSYYKLPPSRVKKLPDEATVWDANGPYTTWIHGKGKKPGTLTVGSKDGSEVKDVPETMVKRKFSKGDPYGATGDYTPRDEMVGVGRVRRESRSLKHITAALLREAADDDKEDGEDSLDAQIDKYLSSYEAEAKNSKNEGLDFRMMTRRWLLEAEGDEDEGEDKEGGGEEEPEKLTAEDLNVKSFVTDVMRLVDNYDNLLEVRNTILRRTINFLLKGYDKDVADAFKEELLDSYGIEVGKSKSEMDDEEFPAPKAGAAGPMAGGGGA